MYFRTTLNNSAATATRMTITIAGTCSSDARFKREVTPFAPVLEKVAALRPVHFYWRSGDFPAKSFGDRRSYGLVALKVRNDALEAVRRP